MPRAFLDQEQAPGRTQALHDLRDGRVDICLYFIPPHRLRKVGGWGCTNRDCLGEGIGTSTSASIPSPRTACARCGGVGLGGCISRDGLGEGKGARVNWSV